MTTLPEEVYDKDKQMCMSDMFDWLIGPCLKQIEELDLFIPFSALHLVKCQIGLLSALLGKSYIQ